MAVIRKCLLLTIVMMAGNARLETKGVFGRRSFSPRTVVVWLLINAITLGSLPGRKQ
jgi:hypothetical protein